MFHISVKTGTPFLVSSLIACIDFKKNFEMLLREGFKII